MSRRRRSLVGGRKSKAPKADPESSSEVAEHESGDDTSAEGQAEPEAVAQEVADSPVTEGESASPSDPPASEQDATAAPAEPDADSQSGQGVTSSPDASVDDDVAAAVPPEGQERPQPAAASDDAPAAAVHQGPDGQQPSTSPEEAAQPNAVAAAGQAEAVEASPTPTEAALAPDVAAELDAYVNNTSDENEEEGDDAAEQAAMIMRYGAVASGLAVLVLGIIGVAMFGLGGGTSDVSATDAGEHRGVSVRRGISKESPEILGEVDGSDAVERTTDKSTPEADEADADGTANDEADENPEEPEDDGQGEAAAEDAPAPAPTVAPKPAPKPTPKPAATSTTLKIRANRKALIFIDGTAAGYTPLDHPATAGTHEVIGMITGQPGTKQVRQIDVDKAGGTVDIQFAF